MDTWPPDSSIQPTILARLPPNGALSLGRIGGESLAVAQNTYAVNWFKGKELNLVFGLQLSMARLVNPHTHTHTHIKTSHPYKL